jgi:hypothetical protein
MVVQAGDGDVELGGEFGGAVRRTEVSEQRSPHAVHQLLELVGRLEFGDLGQRCAIGEIQPPVGLAASSVTPTFYVQIT